MASKIIKVPTGSIIQITGEKEKPLEVLSIGDYGQSNNVKADFLGLTNEIHGVSHGALMPLEEKWVITMSTQYGCSMGCTFCDVPNVGPGINATERDLAFQLISAIQSQSCLWTKRLNVHYARMGEPTFNEDVLHFTENSLRDIVSSTLRGSPVHPVVSTMMPALNRNLYSFLDAWCKIKNNAYEGEAGLQISINSTDDSVRFYSFGKNSLPLVDISAIGSMLPNPKGRKYALNFAVNSDSVIDGSRLASLFSPDKFMCKLTPIHATASCSANGHKVEGYTAYDIYRDIELDLKRSGFDVLVFVPSKEEEEGRITCGNAILADKDTTND